MSKSLLASAALALSVAGLTAPADARPNSVTIRVSDLDLATWKDNAQLDRRLKNAANAICGRVPVLPLRDKLNAQNCHDEVLASSAEQVALARTQADTSVRLARRGD
ncbi:UrcA family protein [Sphingosinicella sp. BN140058]|uniref:UrcA family protein n=1 Tax=Sphingosinicella sp. BN140058 TaxID=1892855 RepID=UPI00101197F9|nr:UrcA family protein [Sphingosinicella sp. BN140058]QAY78456.1 UrcA family protein [Sphingosinicella sp. BN140058]